MQADIPEVVMRVNKLDVSMSCHVHQYSGNFSRLTEWKILSHAQEWKLNRSLSSENITFYRVYEELMVQQN